MERCKTDMDLGEKEKKETIDLRAMNLHGYHMEYEEELKDCNGFGSVYTHQKTGARVCVIANDDDNKVFSIGFRTPPVDSTGVAHIVEHTVLCGSKNFPAKDPFIELAKGSLNTFLNAMTYPDKTIYPVASCNDKDFQNLIHVYMDAVFYPNIYEREEIFKQEGWHYELQSTDAPLELNGIVYSEMKGAYSSPEQQLLREIQLRLFPDTAYGVDSGGNPDVIPELTYKNFLDFHSKYYHPSNSYIYIYGNSDMEEKLNWLDSEYLSKFDKLSVDSQIHMQKHFGVKEVVDFYPIGEAEEMAGKTYLSYNLVIGDSFHAKQCIAFQILNEVLLKAPGAPLKQAILEAGIGKDVLSSYQSEMLQPMFIVIAKDTEASQKDEFVSIIKDTLASIVKKGLNKNSLKAAISKAEFRYREADYGRIPKGLMTGIQMFGSWLYDDAKAFSYLHGNELFDQLKDEVQTDYFENLIQDFLLDSDHVTVLTLSPEKGLTTKKEADLKDKLAAYKETLTKEEIDTLITETKNLRKYQEEPSSKEDLEKIPLLERSDIERQAPELYVTEQDVKGVPALFHDIFTNGIAYMNCLFDLSSVPANLLPYASLLSNVFGYISTKKHSLMELSNEVDIHTGGIFTQITTLNRNNTPNVYLPVFIVNVKSLYEKIPFALEYIREMICDADLEDEKRLLEIIKESKSRQQMVLNSSGNMAAAGRAASYFSQVAYFTEVTDGIEYYRFISDLEANFETKKQEIVENLKKVNDYIFAKDSLLLSVTAEETGFNKIVEELPVLLNALNENGTSVFLNAKKNGNLANWKSADYFFKTEKKNEGFQYSGQVQYVARCGNFIEAGFKPNGVLKVLRTIMNYDYLWNNIRVKGGAYGCSCSFSGIDGSALIVSYRDPNLSETNKVYEEASDYVSKFEADEREMTKYIIGTMSTIDTPLTPKQKGSRSLNAYLSGVTIEDIQKDRDEILNAGPQDVRAVSDLVKAVIDQNNLCVIGNEKKLNDFKGMFMELKSLF